MNEYFTMRLAKAVGLDVPAVHRLYTPQPVYIVDRFDRVLPKPKDAHTEAGADAVKRRHTIDILAAAKVLGLAAATAIRELDRMLKAVPAEADKLIAEIETNAVTDIAACPDPEAARKHIAGELRMLRAARHIVLADMCRQLS